MSSSPVALRLAVMACLLALTACGSQQRQINSVANNLPHIGAKEALRTLKKIPPKQRDQAQYLLNLGTLERLTGDFEASTANLQAAKVIMDSLQAASITENATALTINETLRSYTGTPSERVLLHQFLAFNYLQQGALDDARVEMLQADITMREVAQAGSLSGQLASCHFLSGLIYELNNEQDNAMISYRRAAEILTERQQHIPTALQDSLLQSSYRLDLKDEYQQYVERFERQVRPFETGDKELLIFYTDGNISTKQQHRIPVFNSEHNATITLAMPHYFPDNYQPQYLTINIANQHHRTELLENIEALVREDLAEQLPRITATTMVRAAAKYQILKTAREKQDDLAYVMTLIAVNVSEQADLRSWNMLPSSLQVARIRIPEGTTIKDELPYGHALISFKRSPIVLLLASSLDQYHPAVDKIDQKSIEHLHAVKHNEHN